MEEYRLDYPFPNFRRSQPHSGDEIADTTSAGNVKKGDPDAFLTHSPDSLSNSFDSSTDSPRDGANPKLRSFARTRLGLEWIVSFWHSHRAPCPGARQPDRSNPYDSDSAGPAH